MNCTDSLVIALLLLLQSPPAGMGASTVAEVEKALSKDSLDTAKHLARKGDKVSSGGGSWDPAPKGSQK